MHIFASQIPKRSAETNASDRRRPPLRPLRRRKVWHLFNLYGVMEAVQSVALLLSSHLSRQTKPTTFLRKASFCIFLPFENLVPIKTEHGTSPHIFRRVLQE